MFDLGRSHVVVAPLSTINWGFGRRLDASTPEKPLFMGAVSGKLWSLPTYQPRRNNSIGGLSDRLVCAYRARSRQQPTLHAIENHLDCRVGNCNLQRLHRL